MKRIAAIAAICAAACVAWADSFAVPSGQSVELVEKLIDTEGPMGLTWRYRFLAPAINQEAGSVAADAAFSDIEALCSSVALPDVAAASDPPVQVVISLMDRIVAYGDLVPEATQYFDGFRIEAGECVWEGF